MTTLPTEFLLTQSKSAVDIADLAMNTPTVFLRLSPTRLVGGRQENLNEASHGQIRRTQVQVGSVTKGKIPSRADESPNTRANLNGCVRCLHWPLRFPPQ